MTKLRKPKKLNIILVSPGICGIGPGTELNTIRDWLKDVAPTAEVTVTDKSDGLVNRHNASHVIGIYPNSAAEAEAVAGISSSARLSYVVILPADENSEVYIVSDLIRPRDRKRMSINYFLGSPVHESWRKYLGPNINHKIFIALPGNNFSAQDIGLQEKVRFVVDCTLKSDTSEETLVTLLKVVKDAETPLSKEIILLVDEWSPQMDLGRIAQENGISLGLLFEWRAEKLKEAKQMPRLLEDAIWLFINTEEYLSWARLLPSVSCVPQVLYSETSFVRTLGNMPSDIANVMIWNGSNACDLRKIINAIIADPLKAYERAKRFREYLWKHRVIVESRVAILKDCLRDNLFVLTIDIKRTSCVTSTLRENRGFFSLLRECFGFRHDAQLRSTKKGKKGTYHARDILDARLPGVVVTVEEGSTSLLICVSDVETFELLKNEVITGGTADTFIDVILIGWDEIVPSLDVGDYVVHTSLSVYNADTEAVLEHETLQAERKFDSDDTNGKSFLNRAAGAGACDVVIECLEQNAGVNHRPYMREEALLCAAENDQLEVVSLLIDWGANVNFKDENGRTALHDALQTGKDKIVSQLLEAGADLTVKDKNGISPVFEMDSMLEAWKDGRNLPDVERFERHIRIEERISRYLLTRKMVCIVGLVLLFIIYHFLEPYHRDFPITLMRLAAKGGYVTVWRVFVFLGVTCKCEENFTDLHWAASEGYPEICDFLMSEGRDVEAEIKMKLRPLHLAALYGHPNVVKTLIDKGAAINARSAENVTALHLAAAKGQSNVVEILIGEGGDVEAETMDKLRPLHLAAKNGHPHVVKILVDKGPAINARAEDGMTPLLYAVSMNNVNITQQLLEKGANVHATTKNGKSALFLAINNGNEGMLQILLNFNADMHYRTKRGYSALFYAAELGQTECAHFLLTRGARTDYTTLDGKSLLNLAVEGGNQTLISLLLQAGLDTNIPDDLRKTDCDSVPKKTASLMTDITLDKDSDAHAQIKKDSALLCAVDDTRRDVRSMRDLLPGIIIYLTFFFIQLRLLLPVFGFGSIRPKRVSAAELEQLMSVIRAGESGGGQAG